MKNSNLFEGLAVQKVAAENPISYVDIGTRGGFQDDLASLAFAVDAIGFEPEREAFDKIDQENSGPWRSARILPYAVGRLNGKQILSIPEDPVSATLLKPDPAVGERFDKSQFFKVQKQIEVETKTLDEALTSSGCARHDYLKIDIEGAELEVLGAAPETVKELLAFKTEVSFVRQCLDQPLAHDVAKFFDDHKFELMAVVDSSHWRREGYVIDPYMSPENIRYSRGQLIHADFIFFRSLESLGEDVDAKSDSV